MTCAQAISTITAISGILPFLTKQTAILKKSDPQVVGKLLAAKVIVVAEIIISLIFAILSATDSFEPTSTVSYSMFTLSFAQSVAFADEVSQTTSMLVCMSSRLAASH